MRHTLIPPQERAQIHREYHMRVVIVLVSVMAVAVAVGVAALFPAYISARVSGAQADSLLEAMLGKRDESGLSQIEAELKVDRKLLTAVSSRTQTARMSDVIREISRVRGIVSIYSFTIDRQGTSTIQATLRGNAPTRTSLLKFRDSLESAWVGAKADLPLEELKNSVDLPFSMRITVPFESP